MTRVSARELKRLEHMKVKHSVFENRQPRESRKRGPVGLYKQPDSEIDGQSDHGTHESEAVNDPESFSETDRHGQDGKP